MQHNNATFVTGSPKKAEYLEKLLGIPIKHQSIALDEIQSLSLEEIVAHKVRQAYAHVQAPVLVEDVSLEFESLHGLPGPFIKFFLETMPLENVCRLIVDENRKATARCAFGYFDGTEVVFFSGTVNGTIAREPRGENGYGYDKIFIPDGWTITRAEMSPEENLQTYLKLKPIEAVAEFLRAGAK